MYVAKTYSILDFYNKFNLIFNFDKSKEWRKIINDGTYQNALEYFCSISESHFENGVCELMEQLGFGSYCTKFMYHGDNWYEFEMINYVNNVANKLYKTTNIIYFEIFVNSTYSFKNTDGMDDKCI